jgi:hypothetical protein
MNRFWNFLALGVVTAGLLPGATLFQQVGDEDFANGASVGTGTFTGASAGDPSPFNTFIGSDVNGPNFTASWTFNAYGGVILDPISSATLFLATYDFDTSATGSQVASVTLNGLDVTSLVDTAFEATPALSGRIQHYSISLPGSVFAQLATGSATIVLTLQGKGLGVLGETDFNGGGLDYSSLTVETSALTPEPGTMSLLGAALVTLVGWSRRRK